MIRRFVRHLFRWFRGAFDHPDVSASWLRAQRVARAKEEQAPPDSLNRWPDERKVRRIDAPARHWYSRPWGSHRG